MNRSSSYSPLEMSRRWIKSPRQRASTSSFPSSTTAVRKTRKSFKSTAQSLLSRITCSTAKRSTAICCYKDEAETPFIYWADEKYPNKVKKKDKFVDPFEVKSVEQSSLGASSSVSFEIVGTIHCIRPILDTITEIDPQDQASVDPFEDNIFDVSSSSPTSIKIVGSFDYASPEIVPMRLFPCDDAGTGDVFNKTCKDEEDGFETISFEGVNFGEDSLNVSGAATEIADDESLEAWVDSVGTENGFFAGKDFPSHAWGDETD
mmetsp:Transcript_10208/g.12949  ORF Transcript_10208/g.12949 Transcript_10208/m.12949 type:complete len:262 (-) Transcript_10208:495-1280(-)